MKKQYSLFIHSAFFDMVLQQKVSQVDLSETRDALLSFTTRFYDWAQENRYKKSKNEAPLLATSFLLWLGYLNTALIVLVGHIELSDCL